MITIPLWMRAIDAQLEAITFCDWFPRYYANKVSLKQISSLEHHYSPVKVARPFGWSTDSITAVLEASASIPNDTVLNRHNLNDVAVFWWFEQPLDIPHRNAQKVQAIVAKWERDVFIVTLWYRKDDGLIRPGHFWFWLENEPLSNPVSDSRSILEQEKYKAWTNDIEKAMSQAEHATHVAGKFIIAAFAWLGQKILTVTEENGERHARKRYEKVVKHWHPVSVVQLRKREYQRSNNLTDSQPHSSPSYRFVVTGHWRNQSCGPSHGDRKLIYIFPFVKGPEDAPFKPRDKVYEVTR